MNQKSTLILLSILHICILGICILTIYPDRTSGITVAHVSSDTKSIAPEPESEEESAPAWNTEPETEAEAEPETVTETITETAPETGTEPESEAAPSYAFYYIGETSNLNVRSTPSMNGAIIGKIPVGGHGDVLTLTNDDWVLIDYNGMVGYCSRKWIELQETDH